MLIAIEHLTKRYNGTPAVDNLTFTVETGEICGLLGPNGAGKSTTMNMITGYISATDGTAVIDGCDIFKQPKQARAKIGYLPEQPPVYLDMTPQEYLSFVAELKGVPRAERAQAVAEVMQRTGVTDVSGRLIRNLSKGYKQRVGLAGALVGNPEVIILDEPTVGLDPKQIIEIRTLIRSLAKDHTVLLSSHIMQEISAVCDKVVILSHGKLVACDTPENLAVAAEAGGAALRVTVLADQQKVKHALENVEGITRLEFVACEEKGAVAAQIHMGKNVDLRAAVSGALAKEGCPVLGMQTETMSLEDVFLELTEAAEAVAPADEADDSGAAGGAAACAGDAEALADAVARAAKTEQEDADDAGDL